MHDIFGDVLYGEVLQLSPLDLHANFGLHHTVHWRCFTQSTTNYAMDSRRLDPNDIHPRPLPKFMSNGVTPLTFRIIDIRRLDDYTCICTCCTPFGERSWINDNN
jgi:hypothetical protein